MVDDNMREVMVGRITLWLLDTPMGIRWVYLQHFHHGRMAAYVLPSERHPLPEPLPNKATLVKLCFTGELNTMDIRFKQLRAILNITTNFDEVLRRAGKDIAWAQISDILYQKFSNARQLEHANRIITNFTGTIARCLPETNMLHQLTEPLSQGLPNEPSSTPFFIFQGLDHRRQ